MKAIEKILGELSAQFILFEENEFLDENQANQNSCDLLHLSRSLQNDCLRLNLLSLLPYVMKINTYLWKGEIQSAQETFVEADDLGLFPNNINVRSWS